MKASWKKFLAGVAAAAMTVGGFALGAGTAMAAIGGGSSDDNPLKSTTTDTTARIAVRDDFYESHADRYKAYLVAAYDMDNVKPAAANTSYLDIETLKYTQGDLPDATLKTALTAAGVDSSTLTDTDAIYSALKAVATQSPDAPYGYTDTTNPGKGVATERKFADALGSALDAMSSADLGKLKSTKITPVGQDTLMDTGTLKDDNSTAVPKTGLYLVWDTMKDTTDNMETSTRSVPMLVSSTLYKAPNTVYPGLWLSDGNHTNVSGIIDVKNTFGDVLKQVVEKDGTTPNLNPSYSIGDIVTFQLQTAIPNYAGYTKNTDTTAADARKLLVTDTFEKNAHTKIPFSDPKVTSVKLYRANNVTGVYEELKNGALTPDTDYTAAPTTVSDTDKTVNGMTIDLAKLVNGDGTTAAGATWQTNDSVVITLTATLNKDAFVTNTAGAETTGIDPNGNANSVKVDFSDHTATGHHEVLGPTVNVYSFKFSLVKQYRKDNTPLRNAQFTVKRSSDGKYLTLSDGAWGTVDNEPTADTAYPTKASPDEKTLNTLNGRGVFLTNDKGKIDFNGLEEGTYTVHEIKAPQEYFQNALPSFDITIDPTYTKDDSNGSQTMFDASPDVVSGDHILTTLEYKYGKSNGLVTAADGPVTVTKNTSSVTVDNVKSITELPKTGAAGIAFFTVIGVAVVALAGVFAVHARKASRLA
ncbi:SpaA isopeptide-forming pilin-related protein [Bifidobacterium boum]|uniref:Bifunctional protein: cell surface protein with Gram positive anchor and Cna protein B-type domain n=1 Tax=Bifidobacterium boum TaxID=78343 RepID=A0A086ZIW0_9BIFI|nr:SpaA isopeptide-forming pilin-related protein [Bifidobacterium boum]KFI46460.1 bifunctional protein: cell surface protein with Gram positive anchor and Cna protein B-type domain [Bifidobacterium boum]